MAMRGRVQQLAGVVEKAGWQQRAVGTVIADTPAVVIRTDTPPCHDGVRQRRNRAACRRHIHSADTGKLRDHVAVSEKAHVECSLGAHCVSVHAVCHHRFAFVQVWREVLHTPVTGTKVLQHRTVHLTKYNATKSQSTTARSLLNWPAHTYTLPFHCFRLTSTIVIIRHLPITCFLLHSEIMLSTMSLKFHLFGFLSKNKSKSTEILTSSHGHTG